MNFLSISFSLVWLREPSLNFRLFPDFPTWWGPCQNYKFRVVLYERLAKTELVEVASLKWKCNNLCSFVDFRVPLNSNFELCTFTISAAQTVANRGKWVESRKDGRVLQKQRNSSDRRKSGIVLVLGDGKERQVYFTRWVSVSKGLSQGRLFSR